MVDNYLKSQMEITYRLERKKGYSLAPVDIQLLVDVAEEFGRVLTDDVVTEAKLKWKLEGKELQLLIDAKELQSEILDETNALRKINSF